VSISDKLSRLTPEQRAALALRLSGAKRPEGGQKAVALPELRPDLQNRHAPFPLSDIQQAYLIGRSEGVELGNTGCHCYFEVELEQWDRTLFQTALRKLIDRHEMLRAVILPEGRQQILQRVPPYEIKTQDLRGLDAAEVAARLEVVRGDMAAYVHQTDRWPLFEFRASLLDAGRARLHIGMDLLIADGRSFEIFFGDLAQLYRDPATALPALELSFRDYMLAAEAFESSDAFRQAREYWMKRLPTLPPSPELPLAVNPASIAKPGFNRHRVRVEAATWRTLKEKTTRTGLTAPGVVLAAYAEVLAIWSKNAHFTLNLTLFNRLPLHKQANDIVGDFTSVNLLEVDNTKAEGFEARARKQQEQLWQDLDHRHFSGVRVARELTRQQGVGPKAIMPVVFTSLLNIGGGSEERTWAARLGDPVYSASQTPQVYLDLVTHEDRGSLVVDWFVVDEVFPPNLIDDLFEAFQCLLEQLAADDTAWSRTLAQNSEKLLPAYQTRLLNEANDTSAPVSEEFLHTLFLKQVELRPRQLAVCTPSRRMTYAEVYSRACRIEEELLPRGLEPNQFVGIVMEKGWEQVVAVMGILFAGGAYMPIDPDLPPERQKYLIENGDVKVVLTQSSVFNRVSAPDGVEILTVDQMQPLEGKPLSGRTRQKLEDLAYVIYTSGSTGQPKGVMIDHLGAVNTVLDINQRFAIGPQDRVLALSRLNFDLSVYDIFGLLAAGGTIVMPSAELAQDTAHWAQLVASEKVTIWNTVPALMGLLVEQAEHGENIGDSLRVVLMSGDWIPVALPGQIRRLLPRARIISLGGATEASIWSILYPIEQLDSQWKSVPYGKPMLNQTFHVLNSVQAPCPAWVPGQLYIGGIGLAKGYWRDARKTNGSFIHHEGDGQRLYRTGDWGRYLPDGNIEFLGREDLQVKVQGYRIELGEIEAKLTEYPDVDTCVVTVREDVPGEKRLVGYIIPKSGVSPQLPQLREFLREKLPEYMVPSAIVCIDEFPLTPNGKVDRKALPAVTVATEAPSEKAMARDLLEVQLTRLWERILNVHPVGLRDNFFDLGGNSLMAVRLFSELRKMTGRAMALSTLFQAPTVEKLAEILRADLPSNRWSSLVIVRPEGSRPPFFCVHAAGGNILIYRDLAERLGDDQPFYGLQSQGLDGEQPFLTRIEDMATHYVGEIRKVQPSGPYFLGGFCMGGNIALEIAQQLQAQGEKVALVAFMETLNLSALPAASLSTHIFYQWQRIAFHFGNVMLLDAKDRFRFLWEKIKITRTRSNIWWGALLHRFLKDGRPGEKSEAWTLARLWDSNDRAVMNYVPRPYSGNVVNLRPRQQYAKNELPAVNWEGIVNAGPEVVLLPVYPAGMLIEPFVKNLASELRAAIDRAMQEGQDPAPVEVPVAAAHAVQSD
jgi:pyochelin synthetase